MVNQYVAAVKNDGFIGEPFVDLTCSSWSDRIMSQCHMASRGITRHHSVMCIKVSRDTGVSHDMVSHDIVSHVIGVPCGINVT